jgi:Bacteriophage Sf6, terminase small subunit-like
MTKKKKPEDYNPNGRPSKFSPELSKLVCRRISTHSESLEKLCNMYDDMPAKSTIYEWLLDIPGFSDDFKRARVAQIELTIQELEVVTDAESYIDEKGVKRYDAGLVSQRKLKADNRKWLAAKIIPQLYGDKDVKQDETINNMRQDILELRQKLHETTSKDF